MISLRPFEDGDYPALTRICNACWPDYPRLEAELRRFDADREPGFDKHWLVAEFEGQMVASGRLAHRMENHHPARYDLEIEVAPEHRGRGVARALYTALRAARPEARELIAEVRAGREGAAALEKAGWKQVLREPVSELAVQAFDAAPYRGLIAAVRRDHHLLTRAELEGEDALRRVHALHSQIVLDVPSDAPTTPIPFGQYARFRSQPGFMAEACFLCAEGDQLVGLSELRPSLTDGRVVGVALTGVLRSHRRRGIATALKVLGIEWAKARGAELIRTDNEENNPMYGLNLSLGFQPRPAWLVYRLGKV